MKSVFEYNDYKSYLLAVLGAEGTRTGMRLKVAKALRVHSTYISQVLKDKAELSLDQAEEMNLFLQHSKEEGDFFLLLVMKGRAGTPALRKRMQTQINEVLQKRLFIKDRLKDHMELSKEEHEKFYSSYLYGAIHVLVSIPTYQTRAQLQKALKISDSLFNEALNFLLRTAVIVESQGRLKHGPQMVHLGSDHHTIKKHHTNWRLHSIHSLDDPKKDDVHYSAALSLSEEDAAKIKEILLENLKKNLELVQKSKEEVAYVYNFDFYRLSE